MLKAEWLVKFDVKSYQQTSAQKARSVCLHFVNRRAEHYKSKLFLTWTGAALFSWRQLLASKWPLNMAATKSVHTLQTGEQNILRANCFWPEQAQLYFNGDSYLQVNDRSLWHHNIWRKIYLQQKCSQFAGRRFWRGKLGALCKQESRTLKEQTVFDLNRRSSIFIPTGEWPVTLAP